MATGNMPMLALKPSHLRVWVPAERVDVLIGIDSESEAPLRTRAHLERALQRAKQFMDRHLTCAIGIVADRLPTGHVQAYLIEQQYGRLRVKISKVAPDTMLVITVSPLIASQPDFYYTWSGAVGFARMWFDTLTA
jgi:ribosomal protein L31E